MSQQLLTMYLYVQIIIVIINIIYIRQKGHNTLKKNHRLIFVIEYYTILSNLLYYKIRTRSNLLKEEKYLYSFAEYHVLE